MIRHSAKAHVFNPAIGIVNIFPLRGRVDDQKGALALAKSTGRTPQQGALWVRLFVAAWQCQQVEDIDLGCDGAEHVIVLDRKSVV